MNVALPNPFHGFMYVNYAKRNADVRSLGLYDGVSMALNFHENGVSLFNFKREFVGIITWIILITRIE